jgi:predicted transcriptional regulator
MYGSLKITPQSFMPVQVNYKKDLSAKATRRGKLEILAQILMVCNEPKTKTNIMYNVNLNYFQLKRHMDCLTLQGLLSKEQNKYLTTGKGQEFLELFSRITDLAGSINI